jgi:hypothetical protein
MKRLFLFAALVLTSTIYFISCSKKEDAPVVSCTDGIKNQDETGIDCGGSCAACPTCNDGIKNQGETGVDCGGPCAAVCPTCSDGIQNQNETGIDCGGPCSPCPAASLTCLVNGANWTANNPGIILYTTDSTIIGTQNSDTSNISITIPAPAGATGTFPLNNSQCFYFAHSVVYTGGGSMEITTWDTFHHLLHGTFNFTAINGTDTVEVTNGIFSNLYYN